MNENTTRTAYPLAWPIGWPKTELLRKEDARFKTTLHSALNMLKDEVRLLGGKNLVLSSNYTLGVENPKESGVVAYFDYENQPVAIPCDRWKRVEHNVKAIALTVEAMRGMRQVARSELPSTRHATTLARSVKERRFIFSGGKARLEIKLPS